MVVGRFADEIQNDNDNQKINYLEALQLKRYKLYLLYDDSIRDLYQRRMDGEIRSVEISDDIETERRKYKKDHS